MSTLKRRVLGSTAPKIGPNSSVFDEPKSHEEAGNQTERANSDLGQILESGQLVLDDGAAIDILHSKTSGAIKYKSMEWFHCALLMIAETVSLGILSLPAAVEDLGLVPGISALAVFGALATYTGYIIFQFRLRHPNVLCMADAGFILFGKIGYHIFSWAALLCFIFVMAAHVLSFGVAMNVLTGHVTCTHVWSVVGTLISIIVTLPRTLKNISYYSFFSCLAVTIAVFTLMISASLHKSSENWFAIREHYPFSPTVVAILNITLAYMGNTAFFGFMSELREPRDFKKALFLLQGFCISLYIIVGVVIYCFVGMIIVSPALGSATPTIKKAAYGVVLITIIVAGVVNAHVACKQVFVQIWQRYDPAMVTSRSRKAKGSWVLIVSSSWLLAMVLAMAIPVFNYMLGLISALFGAWFTYGVCGMFWLKMNWSRVRHLRKDTAGLDRKQRLWQMVRLYSLFFLNIGLIMIGAVMSGLGVFVTGKALATAKVGKPFSCADTAPKADNH